MSKNPKKLARKIWRDFFVKHWPIYALGFAAVGLTNVTLVLWTRGLGWFIDFFSNKEIPEFFVRNEKVDTFYVLFFVLLIARVFLFIGRVGWRLTLARRSHHAGRMLRNKVFENVRFFRQSDLDSKYTKGFLMNASTSDVNAARVIFGFTLIVIADVLFLGVLTLWTMYQISPQLTFWSLTALLVLPYAVKKLSSLEIDRYNQAQEFLAKFNDLASQVVSTIRLQRLTQSGPFWHRRLFDNAETYRQKRLNATLTGLAYTPVMGGASLISYIVLFVLGTKFVFDGTMTVGDFVAMQGLVFLLQDPLMELGFIISDFQKGGKSLERLAEIYSNNQEDWLTAQGENEVSSDSIVIDGRGLTFAYAKNDFPIFQNFNIQIAQGERVGIKGPIGSGKSTLVGLLSGLRRDHDGDLSFNGRPFTDYQHETLREEIAVVSQKPFLFASSIRENLTLDLELNDDQLWHYLRVAGLEKDVRRFPDQLDTQLGEWGINLSGGQKQRLTLARAIARNPKVLFFDDCLSAVDTVTEEKILKNLDSELSDTTLIWVAHRDSTLKYCDRVIEMKKERHVDQ